MRGAPPARRAPAPAVPLSISELRAFETRDVLLPAGNPDQLTISIEIAGKMRTISAVRRSLRGVGFQVLVPNDRGELVAHPAPPVRTYRGLVDGVEAHGAALQLKDGSLSGIVDLGDAGTFFIQPARDFVPGNDGAPNAPKASTHVIYERHDAIAPPGICGNEVYDLAVADAVAGDERGGEGGEGGISGAQPQIVEIGFDADFDFFVKNGSSVANTVNDIETVMNGVDFIYDRDVNIGYELTTFVVRNVDANDPYTTSDMGDLLCQFRSTWNSAPEIAIQREVAQLYTGKSIQGNTIGLAWLGGMCNAGGFDCGASGNLSYSTVESRYTQVLSFRQSLSAHELGHNWTALHCNDDGDCHIMCSSNGGCDGISGANLVLGTAAIAQINAYKNQVTCDATEQLPLSPPFLDTFPDPILSAIKWTYVNGALATTAATNEPSPTRSLNLDATGTGIFDYDEIRSNRILLGGLPGAQCSYWTQHKGVEAGKKLFVEYWSSAGDWVVLNSVVSDGIDQVNFTQFLHQLPANALHDGFRLRFRNDSVNNDDDWYIDDVNVDDVLVTAPPNDECNTASLITVGTTIFNTAGANTSLPLLPAGCNEGNGTAIVNDVWYLIQATCTGTMSVTTCGAASFDTKLAAYANVGSCPAVGAPVIGCSDNSPGCAVGTSVMQFPVTQNFAYYIRLGGAVTGGAGSFTVTCNPSAPPCPSDRNNDNTVNAADLAILLGAWGGNGVDLNGDGTTNGADLAIMLGAWGSCP
ncbi:MAG: M12 family metallo-peptidase [Phycisphaerae bacterium]|nr:M12 family metallo-peptidase [Phycisphaerae bacterium]